MPTRPDPARTGGAACRWPTRARSCNRQDREEAGRARAGGDLGHGFSGNAAFPGGILEAALDDEEWYEVTDRVPVGSSEWGAVVFTRRSTRSWWTAGIGSGSSENKHRGSGRFIRGRIFREQRRPAREHHVAPAEGRPDARRTWVDLIDSSHFPYEHAAGVAWFDRADALDHVAQIVARTDWGESSRHICGGS